MGLGLHQHPAAPVAPAPTAAPQAPCAADEDEELYEEDEGEEEYEDYEEDLEEEPAASEAERLARMTAVRDVLRGHLQAALMEASGAGLGLHALAAAASAASAAYSAAASYSRTSPTQGLGAAAAPASCAAAPDAAASMAPRVARPQPQPPAPQPPAPPLAATIDPMALAGSIVGAAYGAGGGALFGVPPVHLAAAAASASASASAAVAASSGGAHHEPSRIYQSQGTSPLRVADEKQTQTTPPSSPSTPPPPPPPPSYQFHPPRHPGQPGAYHAPTDVRESPLIWEITDDDQINEPPPRRPAPPLRRQQQDRMPTPTATPPQQVSRQPTAKPARPSKSLRGIEAIAASLMEQKVSAPAPTPPAAAAAPAEDDASLSLPSLLLSSPAAGPSSSGLLLDLSAPIVAPSRRRSHRSRAKGRPSRSLPISRRDSDAEADDAVDLRRRSSPEPPHLRVRSSDRLSAVPPEHEVSVSALSLREPADTPADSLPGAPFPLQESDSSAPTGSTHSETSTTQEQPSSTGGEILTTGEQPSHAFVTSARADSSSAATEPPDSPRAPPSSNTAAAEEGAQASTEADSTSDQANLAPAAAPVSETALCRKFQSSLNVDPSIAADCAALLETVISAVTTLQVSPKDRPSLSTSQLCTAHMRASNLTLHHTVSETTPLLEREFPDPAGAVGDCNKGPRDENLSITSKCSEKRKATEVDAVHSGKTASGESTPVVREKQKECLVGTVPDFETPTGSRAPRESRTGASVDRDSEFDQPVSRWGRDSPALGDRTEADGDSRRHRVVSAGVQTSASLLVPGAVTPSRDTGDADDFLLRPPFRPAPRSAPPDDSDQVVPASPRPSRDATVPYIYGGRLPSSIYYATGTRVTRPQCVAGLVLPDILNDVAGASPSPPVPEESEADPDADADREAEAPVLGDDHDVTNVLSDIVGQPASTGSLPRSQSEESIASDTQEPLEGDTIATSPMQTDVAVESTDDTIAASPMQTDVAVEDTEGTDTEERMSTASPPAQQVEEEPPRELECEAEVEEQEEETEKDTEVETEEVTKETETVPDTDEDEEDLPLAEVRKNERSLCASPAVRSVDKFRAATEDSEAIQLAESEDCKVGQTAEVEDSEVTLTAEAEDSEASQLVEGEFSDVTQAAEAEDREAPCTAEAEDSRSTQLLESENSEVTQAAEAEDSEATQPADSKDEAGGSIAEESLRCSVPLEKVPQFDVNTAAGMTKAELRKFQFRLEPANRTPTGFTCEVCSGMYKRSFSLKRHYLRCHVSVCYLSERDIANCGVANPTKLGAPISYAKAASSVECPGLYRCHTCGDWFDDKLTGLRPHLLSHPQPQDKSSQSQDQSADAEKSAESAADGKGASSAVNTPSEAAKVSGQAKVSAAAVLPADPVIIPKFLCLYCDKRFVTGPLCRRHQRRVHIARDLASLQNEAQPAPSSTGSGNSKANKETATAVSVSGADGSTTGAEKKKEARPRPPPRPRPHQCPYCAGGSTVFRELKALVRHFRRRHADRYHVCGPCNSRFLTREELEAHGVEKHGRRPRSFRAESRAAAKVASSSAADSDYQTAGSCSSALASLGLKQTKIKKLPVPVFATTTRSMAEISMARAYEVEMAFFSKVSDNSRYNLLHHLDGKLESSGGNEKPVGADASCGDRREPCSDFSTSSSDGGLDSAGSGLTTNSSDSLSSVPFYAQSFPHSFFLSRLDISTQLAVGRNLERPPPSSPPRSPSPDDLPLAGRLAKFRASSDQNACAIDFPTGLNLVRSAVKRRRSVDPLDIQRINEASSTAGTLAVSASAPSTPTEKHRGRTLRRSASEQQVAANPAALPSPQDDVRGLVLSGEWVRPRTYVCNACHRTFPDLCELEEHNLEFHPNVICTHFELAADAGESGPSSTALTPHDLCRRHFGANSAYDLRGVGHDRAEEGVRTRAEAQKEAAEKRATNVTATVPEPRCTKCGRASFGASAEFHRHILECGGDTMWSLSTGGAGGNGGSNGNRRRRKWRTFGSRRRRGGGGAGRGGYRRSAPTTPTPMGSGASGRGGVHLSAGRHFLAGHHHRSRQHRHMQHRHLHHKAGDGESAPSL